MSYKVIRAFVDSTDNSRLYLVGDVYPAKGVTPTKKRIFSLLTGENKNGAVYIEEIADETPAEDEVPAEE